MQYLITTPAAGFTGVSAGVNFTNGAAEVDVPDDDQHPLARALAYFRSQGYGIEEIQPEAPARSKTTSKGAAS
ncbi:hypothetical protein [Streptomyces sp. NPDC101115]|uniref:hypothetical protein n=1 Tax=Streptomyces sp. NPDC101115 TaxID=3366106 RepID=UPI0037FB052B